MVDGATAIFDQGNGIAKGKEQKNRNNDALVARLYQQIGQLKNAAAPAYDEIGIGMVPLEAASSSQSPPLPLQTLHHPLSATVALGSVVKIRGS